VKTSRKKPKQKSIARAPPLPAGGSPIGYAIAFALLARSISRGMQTDVAYALWSAIGTAAIVLIAVLFLGSPVSVAKVVGVGLIIAGVLTLNLAGAH
jgi:small multidrug resistance pump